MDLDSFFDGDGIDIHRLAEVLNGMGHAGRLETIRRWGKRTQSRLFEAVKGNQPLTLDDFVAPSLEPLVEVIHHGKNTLPAFTHFQKRFCKPKTKDDAKVTELYGYNHQDLQPITGPGYFVTHMPEGREGSEGEVDIDYRRIPPTKPATWPEIQPNEARFGRFVYSGMVDVMRGVSNHVSIGRAMKGGKYMDAWFVLCREDRPTT